MTTAPFLLGHGGRRLLRARRERPRDYRAAKREYELSPFDVDCHVTLPVGGQSHAMEGPYRALSVRSSRSGRVPIVPLRPKDWRPNVCSPFYSS